MELCDGNDKVYLLDLQLGSRLTLYDELEAFDIKRDCLDNAQNPVFIRPIFRTC